MNSFHSFYIQWKYYARKQLKRKRCKLIAKPRLHINKYLKPKQTNTTFVSSRKEITKSLSNSFLRFQYNHHLSVKNTRKLQKRKLKFQSGIQLKSNKKLRSTLNLKKLQHDVRSAKNTTFFKTLYRFHKKKKSLNYVILTGFFNFCLSFFKLLKALKNPQRKSQIHWCGYLGTLSPCLNY